jgi:hypothetical protein
VELLAPASIYERSYLEPVYLRGLAYLHLDKGAEAADEFQKIVNHKGSSWGARFLIWGSRSEQRWRATLRGQKRRFRTSLNYGNMPILMFPFFGKPKQNTPS